MFCAIFFCSISNYLFLLHYWPLMVENFYSWVQMLAAKRPSVIFCPRKSKTRDMNNKKSIWCFFDRKIILLSVIICYYPLYFLNKGQNKRYEWQKVNLVLFSQTDHNCYLLLSVIFCPRKSKKEIWITKSQFGAFSTEG